MTGLSDLAGKTSLDWVTGKTTPGAVATRYLALLSVVGADAGTGFTEISGTNYARQDITTTAMAAATATSGVASATNSGGPVAFPTSGADWTSGGTAPIVGFAIVNHISTAIGSTTLLASDYLGNFLWLPCTVSAASPANFTVIGHGFSANDAVVFSTEQGGTAPTLSAGALTGILRVVSVVDANTITLASGGTFNSSTVLGGGTTLNASAVGSGLIRKVTPQAVPNTTTLSVNSSNLTVSIS